MHLRSLAVLFTFAVAASAAAERFDFVALGDMPYSSDDIPALEALVDRANALAPAFSVHVGDIKNGADPCSDEIYERTLTLFRRFHHPLVYTPGDNEWTDCHRAGQDPLERLAYLRRTMFSDGESRGQRPMKLVRQSADAGFEDYVENARWERSGVVFATLHIVGSNNNLRADRGARAEYEKRNRANLAWIDEAFDRAAAAHAPAVVLFFQADLMLAPPAGSPSGFDDTVALIARRTDAFHGPVLLINGDSHRFRVDRPLARAGRVLPGVTRLTVFGDREVNAVRVTVHTDPASFSFAPLVDAYAEPTAHQRPADDPG